MICTFRVNYIKADDKCIEEALYKSSIPYKKIEVENTSMYKIDDEYKEELEKTKIYDEGMIYLQSPSSVLPAIYLLEDEKIKQYIKDNKKLDVLDMCASPGGKSLALQSLSKNFFNIVGLERDKKRYERLDYNINKQGAKVYTKHISAYDINDFLRFDVVILDAPCTGCKTNINDVKKEYLDKLVATQKRLIDKATKVLKKDGILMYSTCSVLDEEDENQTSYILDKNVYEKVFERKIDDDELYEGFYIAKFYKNE